MNLGRGLLISQQNDVVQNGNSWIPLTPQKPRSNLVPAEMQGSYQGTNWQDLIGMYEGLLQMKTNNNGIGVPQDFVTSGLTCPALEEANTSTAGVGLTQDFITSRLTGPGLGEPNICTAGVGITQDFITSRLTGSGPGEPSTCTAAVLYNSESFVFGAGSYAQQLGNNNPAWYRNSQPRYQATRNASYEYSSKGRPDNNVSLYAPTLHGTPVRSNYLGNQPYTPCSRSHLEGHSLEDLSAGSILQKQNNNINSNSRIGGYTMSQQHKDGFPVPYFSTYDLNSPPRTESGIASSAHSCLLFAPVTPDQGKQLKNLQGVEGSSQRKNLQGDEGSSQRKNLQRDEGLSQRKDNQDNLVISGQQKIIEQHSSELLQDLVDSSSAEVRTSLQETQTSSEVPGGIDLNKTPNQKPPRRKHRPKVVVEGKPKRTPKPKTNSPNENPAGKRKYVRKTDLSPSTENPVGKRKYVRKKGLTAATRSDFTNGLANGSETKSCRRVLNFDVENQAEHEHHDRIKGNQIEKPYNLNLAHQDPECSAEINQANPISVILHKEKQPGYSADKHHEGSRVTFTPPTNQMLAGVSSPFIPAAATATTNNHTLNIIARNLMRTPILCQTSSQIGNNQRHKDILGEGAGHAIIPANIDRTRHLLSQRTQVPQEVAGANERGSKRAYYHTSARSHPLFNALMGSQTLRQGISDHNEHYINRSNLGLCTEESWKRKKVSEGNAIPKSVKCDFPISGANLVGQKEVPNLTDQITNQLKGLHISNNSEEIVGKEHTALVQYSGSKEIVRKEHNALVPYKGDASIVPYEQFDPIKRRMPRPKVDLDPETNRLWNLLMGKEGGESTETTNKHTEKWWEEERMVFQGRVDSFIARMHLVQGDRRFSPWKGSVVDSVIGVFLTQNVSDHLSSSAFMSLAAKFPLHQTTQACWWNVANPIIEEPVQIIDPDGTITYHARTIKESVYYQSSTSSETSEQRVEDLVSGTITSSEKKNKWTNNEVISSQASPDSFIYQHIEEARSSSGSNSETEDQIALSSSNKKGTSEISFLQSERTCILQEYQSHGSQRLYMEKTQEPSYQQQTYPAHNGQNPRLDRGNNTYAYPSKFHMQHVQGFSPSSNHWTNMRTDLVVQEENRFENSGKGELSSLPLTGSTISMLAGIDHPSTSTGGMATSVNASAQLTGTRMVQASRETQLAFLDKPPEQSHFHLVTSSGYSQSSFINNQKKGSNSIQLESTYSSEPTRPAEVLPKCHTEQTTTSNKPTNGAGTSISSGRKRKVQGEKTKAFDWDSLRKQVHSKGGRKDRSKNAMDSLDYEALRHADVKEISNTIKERGMNNMLAERMKDFLNRLVEEHESIDLEWLRDVPPDKAKDYLLSIRGLGLKSVECVRLLTLHHVAFPVDTNVGRIAVRLGWVPLQPLPESLQLHLLELYPVLESIQKYLWPRLCKLDQRTLYELHYQMITFGKVFCTKSKPNCNACPMRAECRHFASAFASARLALPGPEDRSIVNSTVPIRVEEIPVPITKPLPLPPADTNLIRETGYINCNSEPIIHEPMTPEQPTEVTESDIEDAFYDDPDEIPTIKLNIEEFTTNLQSFMQEGDLSKAIVALNPQAASIPTPKLKNVSRLRTEHQVYELPDTHPLLEGLDRRELDDPSPYLLAIWTPGETANSIQPPDSNCRYQELGQLCNETTCFSCNNIKETNSQTVRGTLLIPCRTAMRGSFPLNGTYFQVNEVFADHESSLNPIDVPRALIWNLPRRTVYFGTSVTSIFKGLTTEGIQLCFWRGFVCVRGFDQKTRAPRPLMARLHFPASKMIKTKNAENQDKGRPSRE